MFATMCLSFSAARPLESSLLLLPELVIESTARRGASTLFLLTRAAATPLGNHEAGVESHVARQKLRQAVVQRRIDGRRLSFLLLLFFLVLSASVLRGALLQSQVDHPQHLVPGRGLSGPDFELTRGLVYKHLNAGDHFCFARPG